MCCLAKDPADRPVSALEFLRVLGTVPRADDWSPDAALQWWTRHEHSSDAAKDVDAMVSTEFQTIDVRGPMET